MDRFTLYVYLYVLQSLRMVKHSRRSLLRDIETLIGSLIIQSYLVCLGVWNTAATHTINTFSVDRATSSTDYH